MSGVLWDLVVLGLFLKLLLIPAYHSTDFDVHRNWLAITHNLPLAQWYTEATSQWTLDYPPFFAYFEYLLSLAVPQIVAEDGCLDIVAEDGQYGWPTVVFQRVSVMVTELVLALSLARLPSANNKVFALLWMCPAWLILDHMHFQYNTALFGLFVLGLNYMIRRNYLRAAFTFSSLLCFKHIYLYVAPAFFAHLLFQYLLKGDTPVDTPNTPVDTKVVKAEDTTKTNPSTTVNEKPLGGTFGGLVDRSVKLGLATLAPFVVAFGPFVYLEATTNTDGLVIQVLNRLFPFNRGLTHAYWAPNFWALYTFSDRVLGILNHNSAASSTRGIVGQVEFANMPEITPRIAFALTAGFQLVGVARPAKFLESVTLCAFASFLFGWHVHEKAVLLVVVPFALVATRSQTHMRAFFMLLASACFSQFPLIWTWQESLLKTVYTWTYMLIAMLCVPTPTQSCGWINKLYLVGFAAVMSAYVLLPRLYPKYEFAGLMLVSVYSALGVVSSWITLLYLYLRY